MHAEQILKALGTLDPKNDAHWTTDGSPRIDALKLVAITRDHIRQIAPGFCRAKPELPDLVEEARVAKEAKDKAEALRAEAEEAERQAREAHDKAQSHVVQIKDRHTLTRDNMAWNKRMNETNLARAQAQGTIDTAVFGARGNIGQHPIEVNEAARIRSKRKNIVIPVKQ
jgi:hypothetical protein